MESSLIVNSTFVADAERSPERARGGILPLVVTIVAAIVAIVLVWSRRSYVPFWDGRIYSDCVIDAVQKGISSDRLRCAGHVSQAYVGLLVLAQKLAPASLLPMLALNLALLAVGGVALHRMLLLVFPAQEHALGRALVLATFLVHPVVLAATVQPGLDFGLMVFALAALTAVLERRPLWLAFFGTLLVFTKETGVPVYGMLAALYLWQYVLRPLLPGLGRWVLSAALALMLIVAIDDYDVASGAVYFVLLCAVARDGLPRLTGDLRVVVRALLREWKLAIPVVLVGGYLVSGMLFGGARASAESASGTVWSGASPLTLVSTLFRAALFDSMTRATWALMFVIGFMWIVSLILFSDLAAGAVRTARRAIPRPVRGADSSMLSIVVIAAVAEIWLLSRYQTFANARYFLPIYPLALLLAYAALVRLGAAARTRTAVFAAIALLFTISAVRTADPVSRRLWGTFPVGEHSLLRMTSLTGECCGYGRDQLVYNLQFTGLEGVLSDAYASVRPGSKTAIVFPPYGDWYVAGTLDSVSRHRTLARAGTLVPRVVTGIDAYNFGDRFEDVWYFALPNFPNEESLTNLAQKYTVEKPVVLERDGYVMSVHHLRLRERALARPATGGTSAAQAAVARQ